MEHPPQTGATKIEMISAAFILAVTWCADLSHRLSRTDITFYMGCTVSGLAAIYYIVMIYKNIRKNK